MTWQDKRVFITGATGLVGQWLTRELLSQGAHPVILVRDGLPSMWQFADTCAIIRGDVRDQVLLERTLNEYDIDTVYHLAAQADVTYANVHPANAFSVNVMGTVSLLEAIRRIKPEAMVVMASSDKAYGDSDHLPYTEDTELAGRNPYDCSKSCADLVALSYLHTFGLRIAITRCGNIYGGGDIDFKRLVPNTIRRLVRGQTPIIYGCGTETRDFFYVEDVIGAYLCLAEKDARGPYNFSMGDEISVRRMIETICEVMETPVHVTTLNNPQGMIAHQVLDSSRARMELGWLPRFTLEEGLKKTINWYREYLNGG
jgi:CDP-glucose 4,6-dehydratase